MPFFNVKKPLSPVLAQEEYFRSANVPMRELMQAGVNVASRDVGAMQSAGRLVRTMNNGVMDYKLMFKTGGQ